MTIKMIEEIIEWLYTPEGEQTTTEILQCKIDLLKSIYEPVKARHAYYSEIDLYLN